MKTKQENACEYGSLPALIVCEDKNFDPRPGMKAKWEIFYSQDGESISMRVCDSCRSYIEGMCYTDSKEYKFEEVLDLKTGLLEGPLID